MSEEIERKTTILRKSLVNMDLPRKYQIIDDYIYSRLSNEAIAQKNGTTADNVALIISRHYSTLANVRETKMLLANQSITRFNYNLYADILDTEKINKEFLSLLSEPESLVLTDNEMMFCELFNDDGDEKRALEESKLNSGLKKGKDTRDREEYNQSLQLRCFYLRRKPNVAAYLTQIQKEKIQRITNGKEFIQTELLAVIERLRTSGTPQALTSYLKAVEALGRTYGAFDDKLVVENVSGDSALDLIIQRAQEAKARVIDTGTLDGNYPATV